jgi:methylenetetrahydrofolate dehydrogenase (NADP+) / methenyltetrahydrofolate cyclohydrolase
MIIDTKRIKEDSILELKAKLKRVDTTLVLDIVMDSSNSASKKYVQKKVEFGSSIGITVNVHKSYNDIDITKSDGIIIQLPSTIDNTKKVKSIPIHLDVDLLNHRNELMQFGIFPPTIKGILDILGSPEDLKGKNIVVIGQGVLIGKPLIDALLTYEATIISCNEHTHNLIEFTKQGYAVISATGVANLIDDKYISQTKPQIWIDGGTTESNGVMLGDINKTVGDYANIRLCPSPGGVGPLTVVNIFHNLVDMYVLRTLIEKV